MAVEAPVVTHKLLANLLLSMYAGRIPALIFSNNFNDSTNNSSPAPSAYSLIKACLFISSIHICIKNEGTGNLFTPDDKSIVTFEQLNSGILVALTS